MDIEEFYETDPRRRASEEIEFGQDWSDSNGARGEVSWVCDTGELYVMAEPAEAMVSDGIGDLQLPDLPTRLVGVEVLAVVPDHDGVEKLMAGWHDAMGQPNSLGWVIERVNAHRELDAGAAIEPDPAEIDLPGARPKS